MAQFAPTSQIVDPPYRPDYLANAVLSGLSRPLIGNRYRPWGVVKTFFFSFFTFGLAPLFWWPRTFRDFVEVERQQLWHLAEWMRLQLGYGPGAPGQATVEAIALRESTLSEMPTVKFLRIAPIVLALFVILVLLKAAGMGQHIVILATYEYPLPRHRPWQDIFATWNVLLSVGYLLHWLQVCRHSGALVKYTQRFNGLLRQQGLAPVAIPPMGMGVSPFWAIGALIGLCNGALWAVPAMLAGVVHYRYVWTVSRTARSEMAQRVRDMLTTQRPALNVPLPVTMLPREMFQSVCLNQRCLAQLSPGAAFCSRCGTRTGA